jgi:vesicle-associated membrane protein 4
MIESRGEDALAATGQSLYQDPSSEPGLAPSVRHSLKHVERALLQFERSAPISYGSSRMGVHVELEKELSRSRDARGGLKPWVLVSISRKEEVPPSYNESWIPSEGEMYGSMAAGALEGLTAADYDERSRSRSRSRSRVRFQEQYHDPYQPYQHSQPGPSRKTDALQAEIDETVGLMHENINRVVSRGEGRLDSLVDNTDPLNSGAVKFRKGERTKTWYESILGSIPSPNSAINSFQK